MTRGWLRSRVRSVSDRLHRSRTERVCSRRVRALVDSLASDRLLICLLKRCDRWDFDIFLLSRLSSNHPVFLIGCHLFQVYDLVNVFHLNWTRVMHCLKLIENGYQSRNQFHNSTHAADVAQALHCFLQQPQISLMLNPLQKLGCILAAFGHDLYHPGWNQRFLENTRHHLCVVYDNVSVLENFHWRCLVSILKESQLLDQLSVEQWNELIEIVRLLILATDMQRQQEYLAHFKVGPLSITSLSLSCLKTFLRRSSDELPDKSSSLQLMQSIRPSRHSDWSSFCLFERHDILFLLQILIKCADIGNPCRPWHLSQEWSARASAEFFSQGDDERRMGLIVTGFCDRRTACVPAIQSGFMEFVAAPLFSDWDRYLRSRLSAQMLCNLISNCNNWKRVLEQQQNVVASDSQTSGWLTVMDDSRSNLSQFTEPQCGASQMESQRKMSTSALLTTSYHRSKTFIPLERRRTSVPTRTTTCTLWTIESKGCIYESESTALTTTTTDTLHPPSIVSPLLSEPPSCSPSSSRRHSAPTVHPVALSFASDIRFSSLPESADAQQRSRLQELHQLFSFPRRRSLPVFGRQLEVLKVAKQFETSFSSTTSSGTSELFPMVEAS